MCGAINWALNCSWVFVTEPIREGGDIIDSLLGALAGHADVFQLLLEETHGRIIKEAAVVQAAVGNKQAGKQMIELLLDRGECEIQITQALTEAVRNGSMETVEFLVQRLGGKLPVTGNEIRELARNRQNGAAILDLFFNRLAISSSMPRDVLETVAMYGNAALMTVLLDRLGSRVSLSPSVASAAVSNMEYGLEVLKPLLARFGNTSHGYAIMRLLIKKRKQNVQDCLSDGLLSTTAASGN